jgi:uncharacterized iron-regulated membrane protein
MIITLRKLHRYLSLTLASLWLVQALTGTLMVFHWELDDALVQSPAHPISFDAIGRQIRNLNRLAPARTVTALYPTGGAADRFDIHVSNASDETDIVRVNGAGEVLLRRPLDHDFAHTGLIQAAVVLHQSWFCGDRGRLFIGASGVLLLSNLVLGLKLAWPRKGQWASSMMPSRAVRRQAALYSWHRALGLWFFLPAAVLILAGMLLAFDDPIESLLIGDAQPAVLTTAPRLQPAEPARIAPEQAIRVAQRLYPGASIAGMRMPAPESPWFRVRMRQAGELRRIFGTTTVFVSAVSGAVLLNLNAFDASPQQRFLDILYPIHTGEIGGLPARILAFSVACWLTAMLLLGFNLWRSRRARRPA